MATRKCGNIYFRKYFMAVRKFIFVFVFLLILMVGSRSIHYFKVVLSRVLLMAYSSILLEYVPDSTYS